MLGDVREQLSAELTEIRDAGLHKSERLIASPQRGGWIPRRAAGCVRAGRTS